ncbi:MAG TPA: hypothetical protein DIU20_10345 [Cryomorphaceae bacterium]|nr:hypothetical protein [Cryomorphaceae bacterium]
MVRHIRRYEGNQKLFLSQNLEHLKNSTDHYLKELAQKLTELTNYYGKAFAEYQQHTNTHLQAQNETHKKHLQSLSMQYQAYVQQVNQTNEHFTVQLQKLEVSLEDYKGIKTKLDHHSAKLNSLTDKTTELVAEQEKLVHDHQSGFKDLLSSLKQTVEDKVKEQISSGEQTIQSTLEQNMASLQKLSKETQSRIAALFEGGDIQTCNQNIADVKNNFSTHFTQQNEKLAAINSEFEAIRQQLEEREGQSLINRVFGGKK